MKTLKNIPSTIILSVLALILLTDAIGQKQIVMVAMLFIASAVSLWAGIIELIERSEIRKTVKA